MFGPTVYDTGSRRSFPMEERERTPVTEEMSCNYDHEFMLRSRSRSSQVKNCPAPPNRLPSPNIISRLSSCPAPLKYLPSSTLRVVDTPTPPKDTPRANRTRIAEALTKTGSVRQINVNI